MLQHTTSDKSKPTTSPETTGSSTDMPTGAGPRQRRPSPVLSARDVLHMQRQHGNRKVVQRLLSVTGVNGGANMEQVTPAPATITTEDDTEHTLSTAERGVYTYLINAPEAFVMPNQTTLLAAVKSAARLPATVQIESFEFGATSKIYVTAADGSMEVYLFNLNGGTGSTPELDAKFEVNQVENVEQMARLFPEIVGKRLMDINGQDAGKSKILKQVYEASVRGRAAAEGALSAFMRLSSLDKYKESTVLETDALLHDIIATHYGNSFKKERIMRIIEVLAATASGMQNVLNIKQTRQGDMAEGVALPRNFNTVWGPRMLAVDNGRRSPAKVHTMRQKLMSEMLEQEARSTGAGIDIQLNYGLLMDFPLDYLVRVVVHEYTHQYAATADYAYSHDGAYTTLAADKAVNNADSHAYGIMSVLLGRVVAPGEFGSSRPPDRLTAAVQSDDLPDVP